MTSMNGFEDGLYYGEKHSFAATDGTHDHDDDDCNHAQVDYNHESYSW